MSNSSTKYAGDADPFPGSIGAISARIGYDVRELVVAGYSDRQIWRVVRGEISLGQLFAEEPENRGMAAS